MIWNAFCIQTYMHTLVINLTRFGDLLQSQPVLTGLHCRGEKVTLVCLDAFTGTAALLRDLSGVKAVPGARLLAQLDQGWPQALQELHGWLADCRDTDAKRVVNLTPSLSARLLSRALDIGDVAGFGVDSHGFGMYSSPWAAFLQAASAYRGCSPFNLVDLFLRVAGLGPGEYRLREPDGEGQARAAALLGEHRGRKLVAFQLGASQDYRRWPVDAFVRAGRVLCSQTGHVPVLLGTAGEAHLAEEFRAQAEYPSLDLTGRTDLPTLAAVLSHVDLLLTNDTGTMHLAAGMGVPVAAIFLATAQPFDTGPYREGSLSLEPDLPCHPCSFGQKCPHGLVCRNSIDGSAVGGLLAGLLRSGEAKVPTGLGARVWQARRDERGFMDLFSVSGHEHFDRTRWVRIQRDVYRQFLDLESEPSCCQDQWIPSPFRDRLCRDLERAMLMLTLVEEQAKLLALHPQAPVRSKFLANCQNLQTIFSSNEGLGVLGHMWRYQTGEEAVGIPAFLELCARYRKLLAMFNYRLGVA